MSCPPALSVAGEVSIYFGVLSQIHKLVFTKGQIKFSKVKNLICIDLQCSNDTHIPLNFFLLMSTKYLAGAEHSACTTALPHSNNDTIQYLKLFGNPF